MSGLLLFGRWLWAALRSIPLWVYAVVAALLVVGWAIDRYGDHRAAEAAAAVQARWDDETRAEWIAAREAEHDAAALEAKRRAAYAAAVDTLNKEKADALAERDAVLADAAAGRLRLRDKFRCPAAAGVPEAAAGSVGSDPPTGGVLSGEDQGFLVRIGAEADAVTRQLTACQRILAEDRRMP